MVHLGDLVACVYLGSSVKVLLLLINVVLLQELGALDLVCLEQLEVSLYYDCQFVVQGKVSAAQ
jgi:hypothetical protein